MENFFEGLEDRWTGGWPPFRRIWAIWGRELEKNWRKLVKKGRQLFVAVKWPPVCKFLNTPLDVIHRLLANGSQGSCWFLAMIINLTEDHLVF
jgi:hypothetical protein